MSILPQELMRKLSATRESSERTSSSKIPDQRFRELMKVTPADERSKKRDLFSLYNEEEDDEDENNPLSSGMFAAQPVILTPSDEKTDGSAAVMAACASTALDARGPAVAMMSTPTVSLPPGIEALFEKMASEMLVMCSSGETETTLFLDNPHFASSIFFGTQITIREFNTAPKAFNIEITAFPTALAALGAGMQGLLAAFQNGKFNFSVHRIDTLVKQHEERPVLHRKESGDRDQQDRRGGRDE